MAVTKQTVVSIATSVRESLPNIHGYCYPASNKISKRLQSNGIATDAVTVEQVYVGDRTTRHYVVAVDASAIKNASFRGRMLVDATLDQYSKENYQEDIVSVFVDLRENIADVNIYESYDESPYC